MTYYIINNNQLLRLFYSIYLEGEDARIYKDKGIADTFTKSVESHMKNFLNKQAKLVKNYEYPRQLIRLRMMYEKGMLPLDFIDDKSKNKMFNLFDKIKSFDDLDQYTFIFPLDPKEVPEETKKDTYENYLKNRTTVDMLKHLLDDIKTLVDFSQPIPLKIVNEFLEKITKLSQSDKQSLSDHMEEIELSIDDIEEFVQDTQQTDQSSEDLSQVELLELLLQEIEDYITSDEYPPKDLTSELLETIDTLTSKQLEPYLERINSIIDFLEAK